MLDHTQKDYYEQVAKQAVEDLRADDERIAKEIEALVESGMHNLRRAMAHEFGWASVRSANLTNIEDIVMDLLLCASDKAKHVLINRRAKEANESLRSTIDCVFAGMEFSKRG